MSLTLDYPAMRIAVKYVEHKKNRYYYRRRIPDDVRRLHPGKKGFIYRSLKTSDPEGALRRSEDETRRLNALWKAHREGGLEYSPELCDAALAMLASYDLKPGQYKEYEASGVDPDRFLDQLALLSWDGVEECGQIRPERLPIEARLAADLFYGKKPAVFLSQALDFYQRLVGEEEETKEYKARRKAVFLLMEQVGDLPVVAYTRDHANGLVEHLLAKGLSTSTVKRYLNYISPVFNTAIRENELEKTNVFSSVRIPGLGKDMKTRDPFTTEELTQLQRACVEKDDSVRWLIALLSDTGMRVAEAVGLRAEDIRLDADVPHLIVRPNASRGLKTAGSERVIPLIGHALWAAQRLLSQEGLEEFLFPQYIDIMGHRATHASNTISKWIKAQGIDKTAHSLRHAFRDRLRNVGAPEEVADRLGGWATKGVGQSYGAGHSLRTLKGWMDRIAPDCQVP